MSVAIIGGDGSGKTTVARQLVSNAPRPTRYVYLGSGFGAQNIALPTTRLLAFLKTRAYEKRLAASGRARPATAHEVHQWSVRRGRVAGPLVLLHRLADESYRSLAVSVLRRRGFDVVCDRHFLFEYAGQLTKEDRDQKPLAERLHLWFVQSVCPRPDLFVFLHVPPAVLVTRKPELTVDQQERYRAAVTALGRTVTTFVAVDGNRPPSEVAADIADLLARHRT